jgi:hypothetical protein
MHTWRSFGWLFVVWGVRLLSLGTVAFWLLPTQQFESTGHSEYTYFALGWPNPWLISEVTLSFHPTVRRDGSVSYEYNRRGPLTVWDPRPRSTGIEDCFTYTGRQQINPWFGPIWQPPLAILGFVVAAYLNQFRRRSAVLPSNREQSG